MQYPKTKYQAFTDAKLTGCKYVSQDDDRNTPVVLSNNRIQSGYSKYALKQVPASVAVHYKRARPVKSTLSYLF